MKKTTIDNIITQEQIELLTDTFESGESISLDAIVGWKEIEEEEDGEDNEELISMISDIIEIMEKNKTNSFEVID